VIADPRLAAEHERLAVLADLVEDRRQEALLRARPSNGAAWSRAEPSMTRPSSHPAHLEE